MDITRTFNIDGKFTPSRQVVQRRSGMSEAIIAMLKPQHLRAGPG